MKLKLANQFLYVILFTYFCDITNRVYYVL